MKSWDVRSIAIQYCNMSYFISKILRKILNPPAIKHSDLDKTAKCDIGCNVSYSKMGRYSYLGEYTSLSMVEVGNFTSISSGCTIGGGNHPIHWVAMSPVFQGIGIGRVRKKLASHAFEPHKTTYIGNDVWIGGNCLIKGGIHIADGAVIGMGAVVIQDVGPYEIWAGNPARFIRKRFDDQTITALLSIKWWDWSDEMLIKRGNLINDVDAFVEKWNTTKEKEELE